MGWADGIGKIGTAFGDVVDWAGDVADDLGRIASTVEGLGNNAPPIVFRTPGFVPAGQAVQPQSPNELALVQQEPGPWPRLLPWLVAGGLVWWIWSG